MNLKTNDRACAAIVAMICLLIPLSFWQPIALLAVVALVAAFIYLNRSIFGFYLKEKGILFAAMTLPWQLLYFLYSGVAFVACWLIYALPMSLGLVRREVG